MEALNTAAVNRRAQKKRNTVKKEESIEPAILTAIGILLHCHSTSMNMNATINSIILHRGSANKMTFKHFNHIALCLSYLSTLKLQSELGKENLSVTKEWTKTSVIKVVSSEGATPVSPEKVVPKTEISSPFCIHSDPSRNVPGLLLN